ncbi:cupin domain-containing protein [Photobacterium sp. CCB-ST2H9]|uniref:cupin domain-containing protein n=1 Tax=Photobacterium sp. CCB-ST2H9 TaxID=2912855 RepID=UPI0020051C46|nr:cupin domain-containing protein [Photobacterium sp. CCB-ST2H9]UTM60252.1 cupin domain-containing protein [Photobacterium sp. CCB-ST2H9]
MALTVCQDGVVNVQDLLADIPENLPEELFQNLLVSSHLRVERIVSRGHQTPAGDWYDQDENEWVLLIQGEAELVFDDSRPPVHLKAGQSVFLPAHCRHRVNWTAEGEHTIWLAIFFPAENEI